MTTTDPTPTPTEPTTPATTTGTGAQTAKPQTPAEKLLSQSEVDAHVSNARKQAKDAARKELLKELGIEDDDPKAVEGIKGKLTAAQQAEEAQKSEAQKAADKITKLEADLEAAKLVSVEAETKRRATFVDSRLLSVVKDAKAVDANEVVQWLRDHQTADVDALYQDGDKFNDKGAEKLVTDFKKVKEHWFQRAGGVGSPSMMGGRPLQPDADMNKKATEQLRRQIRNS